VPTLLLLRHGKSDWHGDEADRDRPLSPRGRRASTAMGRFLSRVGELPDAALASPAVRAMETLRLVIEAAGWTCPAEEREGFYSGGVAQLLAELQAQRDSVGVLLAVGHEPTWSEAVAALTGGNEVRMPTASMARIEFDALAWSQVREGRGVLTWLVTPRLVGRV
jgi:phosphohistidine phosphatase